MKLSVRFVLALVLCFALSLSGMLVGVPTVWAAGTGTWTAVNTSLTSEYVSCLAINPTTPSTQYVGTDGGLFLHDDMPSYALTTTTSPSAGGSIKRSPDAAAYTFGTVVTLTATPAAGYVLIGWSGDLSGPPRTPDHHHGCR